MAELRFAISLSQAATDIWTIDSGIATLAVLAEESLAQASFQTQVKPSLDG